MTDIQTLLKRQASWQRSRRSLSWPEKIRMAERVRDSILSLRAKNRRVEIVAAVGEIKARRETG